MEKFYRRESCWEQEIQLFCDGCSIIIRYNSCYEYLNLKEVLYSKEMLKVFHSAVFDVSFLGG